MAVMEDVGQHILVDFSGTEVTPGLERLIRAGRIGGVILFRKNIASAGQVRSLCAEVQRLAHDAGLPPLWISVDQEGGVVNQLLDVPLVPSAMAIGATGSPEEAATSGRIAGSVLRWVGVNTNHAPVLDVNTNPQNPIIGVRSFGEDPEQVAQLGCAYLRAMQSCGVLPTPKHFPGHGSTSVDSHVALPVVRKDRAELERCELVPFRAAFEAGAEALMTAHVLYPALDPDLPATLSPRILDHLLRRELGFSGLVFTDALGMRAVRDRWTLPEAAVAALRAGADVVLALGPEAEQWEAIRAVRASLRTGALRLHRLRESQRRILRAKERYATPAQPTAVEFGELEERAQQIADRAATLVCDQGGRIPLPPGPTAVLHLGHDPWVVLGTTLGRELLRLRADTVPVRSEADLAKAEWTNVVVASLTWRSTGHLLTVRRLWERFGDRLVVVGIGNPYELAHLPEESTYLAVYGPDPASLRAAARVLCGVVRPGGRLPVTLGVGEAVP